MIIKKNSNLIRFLNIKQTFPTKHIFALSYFVCSLVITRKITLSNQLYQEVISGDFKQASRRFVWYLQAVIPKIEIADDKMFYFPVHDDFKVLKKQEEFVDRVSRPTMGGVFFTRKLLLRSAYIHLSIEKNLQSEADESVALFYDLVDRYLDFLRSDSLIFCDDDQIELQGMDDGIKAGKQPIPFQQDFRNVGGVALVDFSSEFSLEEFSWFVTGGTCLGLAREGSLLSHDFDIDVGVFYSDSIYEELCKIALTSDNFNCLKVDSFSAIEKGPDGWKVVAYPALLKLVHKNGVNIDIFFHYRSEGAVIHGSSTISWSNTDFTCDRGELSGVAVFYPSPVGKYLYEHYGNWKVVKKEFSCATDTNNMHVQRSFIGVSLLLQRLSPELAGKFSRQKSLFSTLQRAGVIELDIDSWSCNRFFIK